MDKILAAIKCPTCRNILSIPILLPCGHAICKEHTDGPEKFVFCNECQINHSNNGGFVVIKMATDIISSRIDSLNFGAVHEGAKQTRKKLENELLQIEQQVNDLPFLIHQPIHNLKSQVTLKSEELKLLIDGTTQKIIDHLNKYEEECKKNLESLAFTKVHNEFKMLIKKTRIFLENSMNALNNLKYDEAKYDEIKSESQLKLNELTKSFQTLNKKLLMDQNDLKNRLVQSFRTINIEPLFKIDMNGR